MKKYLNKDLYGKVIFGDFPGGPPIKTLQCWSSILGQGNKTPRLHDTVK